jgi:hypothetical protein
VKCCGKKSCINVARKHRKITNATLAAPAVPVQDGTPASKSPSFSDTTLEKILTSGALETKSGDEIDDITALETKSGVQIDDTTAPIDITTTAPTTTIASVESTTDMVTVKAETSFSATTIPITALPASFAITTTTTTTTTSTTTTTATTTTTTTTEAAN